MALLGVPSVGDEMTLSTHHADQFVDTHPRLSAFNNICSCGNFLSISGDGIRKPVTHIESSRNVRRWTES
jgi:hypothetical protein